MSYLGFQSTVRDRILAAAPPAGIAPDWWQATLANLRKDDAWDQTVFDAIRRKNPAPVFPVPDELREQVLYWKDRRNDCAHFKSNAIGAPHVESFWMFIQSNLAKLVVNGSANALLAKIERHYDPSFTQPGADPSYLAAEISLAVEPKELASFFEQLESKMKLPIFPFFGTNQYSMRPEFVHFMDAVFRQKDSVVQTEAVKFLSAREGLLLEFLRHYPGWVLYFSRDATLVRKLWYVHLFVGGYRDFSLYAALLRNNLIPQQEIAEAHQAVLSRVQGDIPGDESIPVLQAAGFFQAFEHYAFEQGALNEFSWGNVNALLIRWYVERFQLSILAVQRICSFFFSLPYPFVARDVLNSLFSSNSAKRDEFRAIAAQNNFLLPPSIPSLH